MDVFGYEEDKTVRTGIFRGVRTSKSFIGFNSLDAYELLGLGDHANQDGVKFLLNLEVNSKKKVDELVTKAKRRGATLIKEPYKTYYNWYQAVILDPEGNCIRINRILGGEWDVDGWKK